CRTEPSISDRLRRVIPNPPGHGTAIRNPFFQGGIAASCRATLSAYVCADRHVSAQPVVPQRLSPAAPWAAASTITAFTTAWPARGGGRRPPGRVGPRFRRTRILYSLSIARKGVADGNLARGGEKTPGGRTRPDRPKRAPRRTPLPARRCLSVLAAGVLAVPPV